MSSFYQLISNIKRRTSMYLGSSSIDNLQSFLAGYSLARRELSITDVDEEDFESFQVWIQAKFRISSNQSWDKIILFFSEDENSALTTFFKLFDEFLNSRSPNVEQECISIQSPPTEKKVKDASSTAVQH